MSLVAAGGTAFSGGLVPLVAILPGFGRVGAVGVLDA